MNSVGGRRIFTTTSTLCCTLWTIGPITASQLYDDDLIGLTVCVVPLSRIEAVVLRLATSNSDQVRAIARCSVARGSGRSTGVGVPHRFSG